MNQKLENEDNHPPSGLISKIKKFFRNPFFIKTQSVSEVTDFLKDAVDLNIIDKEAESIANKACLLYTSPSPRDGLLSRMPSSA